MKNFYVLEKKINELPSQVLKINLNSKAVKYSNIGAEYKEHYIKSILKELQEADKSESLLHLEMVGTISEYLFEKLGRSSGEIKEAGLFARLHDIGKIGIPQEILNKKGKLTLNEFQVVKTHTEIGYNLLKNLEVSEMGLNIIRFHHEKWAGNGYYGLRGTEIPEEARVVAVADVYDALRMERPYKKPMSHKEAMDIILKDSGTHFDPELVGIFLENEKEIERFYSIYNFPKLEKEIA